MRVNSLPYLHDIETAACGNHNLLITSLGSHH